MKESLPTPTDHPVTVRITGAVPVGATCAWSFDDGEPPPRQSTLDCNEPINLRVRYGRPTRVTVDVSSGPDAAQRVGNDIEVRDIFIAGLGDSVASGGGNPDPPGRTPLTMDFVSAPILAAQPECIFAQDALASRAPALATRSDGTSLQKWQSAGAQWLNQPVTVRFIATRPELRSRWPCKIRKSR